jgi:hypothetical protein
MKGRALLICCDGRVSAQFRLLRDLGSKFVAVWWLGSFRHLAIRPLGNMLKASA